MTQLHCEMLKLSNGHTGEHNCQDVRDVGYDFTPLSHPPKLQWLVLIIVHLAKKATEKLKS